MPFLTFCSSPSQKLFNVNDDLYSFLKAQKEIGTNLFKKFRFLQKRFFEVKSNQIQTFRKKVQKYYYTTITD